MKLKLYPYALVAHATFVLLANTLAVKLFPLGPLVFTSGIIIFPLSYILGDVIAEVYGYRGVQKVVLVGIAVNIFASLAFWVTVRFPGVDPVVSDAYARVLDQVPRMVLASTCGIWAGQHANAVVLSRLKVLTRGKFLWVRTISSTLVGETVDTAVFVSIGFGGVLPISTLLTMVWSAALFKTVYEALATPVTYMVVAWWKRVEGVDTYDFDEDYNPLVVR